MLVRGRRACQASDGSVSPSSVAPSTSGTTSRPVFQLLRSELELKVSPCSSSAHGWEEEITSTARTSAPVGEHQPPVIETGGV